jgi:hypothetical protein
VDNKEKDRADNNENADGLQQNQKQLPGFLENRVFPTDRGQGIEAIHGALLKTKHII